MTSGKPTVDLETALLRPILDAISSGIAVPSFAPALLKELLSHPEIAGLGMNDIAGIEDEQQKTMAILGEFYAKVAGKIGKTASQLLMKAQWGYTQPEWFDHRHHLLDPDEWFTDHWTAPANLVIEVLPLDGTLLDLCSGDGFYDYHFYRKRAREILCIDHNPDTYRYACRLHKAPNITYVLGDVLAYSYREAYYDVVMMRGAIEHFSRENQQIIFKTALGALRPGGWFCGDTIAKSDTGQKHLQAHTYEWRDEEEMRSELSTVFSYVKTRSLKIRRHTTDYYTYLLWQCQK